MLLYIFAVEYKELEMPVDNKRLPVPDDSCHPSFYAKEKKAALETDVSIRNSFHP